MQNYTLHSTFLKVLYIPFVAKHFLKQLKIPISIEVLAFM